MIDLNRDGRLRLAIQKSGRLSEACLDIFARCDLTLRGTRDALLTRISGLPIDALLVRDDDIPGFVAEGVADFGIVGRNVFIEQQLSAGPDAEEAQIAMDLGFARCRLSIAAPEALPLGPVRDLAGLRIATSYPAITRRFLAEHQVEAEIVTMTGSVEVAPRLQIADVICDLVSTGGTLAANGLTERHRVLESSAVLIQRPQPLDEGRAEIAARLMTRLGAVLKAAESRYVVMHAPVAALDRIMAIVPGSDAPTVSPLRNRPDRVSVAVVVQEQIFWSTLEDLKRAGASDILVLPIQKILE